MSVSSTSGIIDQFQESGYLILRDFFEPSIISDAKKAMNRLVDQHAQRLIDEGIIKDPLNSAPFETRLYDLYKNCLDKAPLSFRPELHMPELFPLFFNPRLLDTIEEILGPELRLYPNYTARPKLPDFEGTRVLWHQDGGYTEKGAKGQPGEVDKLRMVNVWAPLVPANHENGCMQFVPGSHKLGVVPHIAGNSFYLEIDRAVLDPLLDQAVDIELDPGDVVFFHNLMFHQGLPNHASTIRWSLDWRYQDATQSTLREHQGHLARSRKHPEQVVNSATQWGELSFR